MDVTREAAKQLTIPIAMIALGVLIWTGILGETTTIALLGLLIIITAVRLGCLSTEIWPRQ